MPADEITDEELESLLGGVPEDDDNLPEAEEPPDEEIEDIEEDLGDLAEDAPGVSSEDLEESEETGGGEVSESENGEAASAEDVEASENGEAGQEEYSLDDFVAAGEEPEELEDERPGAHHETLLDDEERQNKLINEAQKAGYSEEEAAEGMEIVEEMERLENAKSEIGFNQADTMRAFLDQEIWKKFNYGSFRKFFHDSNTPISPSAAYRYRNVALFMDEFPIGSKEFDEEFYEDTGIEKKEVVDSDTGEVDEERTRRANSLTTRLNFTDVTEVASLFNNGHVDYSKARELLKKSLILPKSEFNEVVDMEREGKDTTVTDELTERGMVGPTFVVNAQNEEKAAKKLRKLADDIEDGRQFSRPVLDGDEGVEKIGSKSVTFHELQDGTLMGDI